MGVDLSGGLRIDANTDGARDATTDPIMADTANARMDTRIDEATMASPHQVSSLQRESSLVQPHPIPNPREASHG